jgi:hypothetical protein
MVLWSRLVGRNRNKDPITALLERVPGRFCDTQGPGAMQRGRVKGRVIFLAAILSAAQARALEAALAPVAGGRAIRGAGSRTVRTG